MSLVIAITALVFLGLAFVRRPYAGAVGGAGVLIVGALFLGTATSVAFWLAVLAVAALAVVFGRAELRSRLVTRRLMPLVAGMLPRLGDTERAALEAGSVWWDGELFSGDPDWQSLLDFQTAPLTANERRFLDGPVEALCRRLDDWDIRTRRDLPDDVWETLRRERFFGMNIPEEYGGLGLSAQAQSRAIVKLASRSVTAAVTAMVPNSLGPGELLVHYGTKEQREHYLPRLARGDEIPCFALTGPEAGSDAAATQSVGVVCEGEWEGERTLGIRLDWQKRYITLAPVASLIGLAFRLRDPDGLLGDEEDVGISCALVPADLPGIEIGRRHDPMGIPFQNGPITGAGVFVPLTALIGGAERAGHGWRMLMDSLSAGRAISLPSLAVAGAKLSTRVASAYATVREQFDTPIGRFEGVQEPLARMAGLTYAIEAARETTAAAIDHGESPAVLSAIVKAYTTEAMRGVVGDAMDVRAGAAIMRGPRNILEPLHLAVPIGITVEGANILTRSMIIYGQGAIRCHPFVLEEMEAVAAGDVERFDRALFGHVGFTVSTAVRSLLLSLTHGRLARVPAGGSRRMLQRLTRLSAAFALVSDAALATLGGGLKRRESLSGRLADALAWLYLGSCTVRQREHGPHEAVDDALAAWATDHALHEAEQALHGVLRNLPSRPVAWLLHALVLPLGRREPGPDDALQGEVAEGLLADTGARDRLTDGIFLPRAEEEGLGRLEAALVEALDALEVERKIKRAVREHRLDPAPGADLDRQACAAGIVTRAELERLGRAEAARAEAIRVDAFEAGELGGPVAREPDA